MTNPEKPDLWTRLGVSMEEIIDRLPERTDEECEAACDFIVNLSQSIPAKNALILLPTAIHVWGPSSKDIIKRIGLPKNEDHAELAAMMIEFLVREYIKEYKKDVT